ncbi:MAG: hypothetical protein KGI58_00360 [Patescibacteria group bacterium]|nr:hypothetical protein [Patescibacteria group bacterium]
MNNFFRNIIVRITGIGWCGTPYIQMEKDTKVNKNRVVKNVNNKDELHEDSY